MNIEWLIKQIRASRDGGMELTIDDVCNGVEKCKQRGKGVDDDDAVLHSIHDEYRKRTGRT